MYPRVPTTRACLLTVRTLEKPQQHHHDPADARLVHHTARSKGTSCECVCDVASNPRDRHNEKRLTRVVFFAAIGALLARASPTHSNCVRRMPLDSMASSRAAADPCVTASLLCPGMRDAARTRAELWPLRHPALLPPRLLPATESMLVRCAACAWGTRWRCERADTKKWGCSARTRACTRSVTNRRRFRGHFCHKTSASHHAHTHNR